MSTPQDDDFDALEAEMEAWLRAHPEEVADQEAQITAQGDQIEAEELEVGQGGLLRERLNFLRGAITMLDILRSNSKPATEDELVRRIYHRLSAYESTLQALDQADEPHRENLTPRSISHHDETMQGVKELMETLHPQKSGEQP
jgi:hypothetical protein